jgi:hypothetical protein
MFYQCPNTAIQLGAPVIIFCATQKEKVMENKVCSKCQYRCYAVHYAGLMDAQFCQVRNNEYLKYIFVNYNENRNGCEKFKEGINKFYGKPSTK